MKPTDLATHLTAFLTNYLPAQRNVSPNTIKAYRDAFVLLLRYCRDVRGMVLERLNLKQIDPPLVIDFLNHLTQERRWTVRTRNLRLTALHAFFRYLQIEEPGLLLHCQRILAIPLQRHASSVVEYLSPDDLADILKRPDIARREGRRDAVLLSVLYDAAARVQELIDLTVRDVRLESPAQIQLTGKGQKTRLVPLMNSMAEILAEYVQEQGLNGPDHLDKPLFQNRRGGRLSRSGVRYILEKYVDEARRSRSHQRLPQITPHIFRHTKAMHLLQSGNPLVVIRDFLGHTAIKSTEIYARADMEMKRQALGKADDKSPLRKLPSWQKNTDLMDWLSSL